MKLNEIKDNQGARKSRNRVGRGMASGNGKTAGRGHKGQGARSGGKTFVGFEGGQNPLYRRLPMRGFNNANFTKTYTIVNVGDLQRMVDDKRLDASKPVTIESLQAIGLTKQAQDGLKVLGSGDISVKLTITAAAASKSAQDKITKAGGTLSLLPGRTPVAEKQAAHKAAKADKAAKAPAKSKAKAEQASAE